MTLQQQDKGQPSPTRTRDDNPALAGPDVQPVVDEVGATSMNRSMIQHDDTNLNQSKPPPHNKNKSRRSLRRPRTSATSSGTTLSNNNQGDDHDVECPRLEPAQVDNDEDEEDIETSTYNTEVQIGAVRMPGHNSSDSDEEEDDYTYTFRHQDSTEATSGSTAPSPPQQGRQGQQQGVVEEGETNQDGNDDELVQAELAPNVHELINEAITEDRRQRDESMVFATSVVLEEALSKQNTDGFRSRKGLLRGGRPSKTILLLVGLAVVVGASLGIAFSVMNNRNNDGGDGDVDMPSPTTVPPEEEEAEVQAGIPDHLQPLLELVLQEESISSRDVFEDATSPQRKALEWIYDDNSTTWNHEGLNKVLLQRFGLATIYFATDGTKWVNGTNWLSKYDHECTWDRMDYCANDGETIWYDLGLSEYIYASFRVHLKKRIFLLSRPKLRTALSHTKNDLAPCLLFLQNKDGNKLVGTIPPEIGLLTHMRSLSLCKFFFFNQTHCRFSTISFLRGCRQPPSFCYHLLTQTIFFVFLPAYNSLLTGTIPTQIGYLTELTYLAWSEYIEFCFR